jgi:hypothetical protein
MTQAKQHSGAPRSAYSICREWRQVHLKCAYELSITDENDDEGVALLVAVADASKHELERDLTDASMTIVDDPHSVLGIALTLLSEGIADERVSALIAIARRGTIALDAASQRRAAA